MPAEEFDAAVAEWAEKLARKSPVLMRLGKDAMFRQQDMAFADALDFLRSQLTIAFSTEDIQEGVKAFFEKREPRVEGPLTMATDAPAHAACCARSPRTCARAASRSSSAAARRRSPPSTRATS